MRKGQQCPEKNVMVAMAIEAGVDTAVLCSKNRR